MIEDVKQFLDRGIAKIIPELPDDIGQLEVLDDEEARTFEPQVVFVDRQNRIIEVGHDGGDVPDGFGLKTSAVTHRHHG